MPTQLRRTRRLRGSRTHGWGRSGQHRGSGNQGGHGNAGWKRHKWSAVIRYNIPVQHKGFTPPNRTPVRSINVGDLSLQLERLLEDGTAKQQDGKVEIDLRQSGYQKLLGAGRINRPLRVLVAKASEQAGEKVRQAGGEIVVPSQEKKE